MPPAIPRGIRNNNPGNIDRTAERWQGMSADQSGDPRFVVFDAPKWGLRALAKLLLNYQGKHGLNTPAKIIGRWAPPNENDTGSYARAVAKAIGAATPDTVISLRNPATLAGFVTAIVAHENGQQPYTAALIAEAVALALQ